MIVIVFGLPVSGKSFFASQLADMLKAEYLSSDKMRRAMFDTRTYSIKEKLAVYKEMLKQIREAERQHINLVLDATFYKKDIRKLFLDGVEDMVDIIFIEVRAEESLIRERLKRPRKDSEADFAVYKKIKKQWEPMHKIHLVLQSTDNNIKDMLAKTAEYLHLRDDKRTN
jgi:predicted kinase